MATLAREVRTDWWQARRSISRWSGAGAETVHRGPDAPAWRRSWALDAPPNEGGRGSTRWPQ